MLSLFIDAFLESRSGRDLDVVVGGLHVLRGLGLVPSEARFLRHFRALRTTRVLGSRLVGTASHEEEADAEQERDAGASGS
jgi:hypothetical protein